MGVEDNNGPNGGHLPSYYIYGSVNNEPIIFARRESANQAAGQTKVYSKYKVIQYLKIKHPSVSKEEILNILKIK